jgi:uracil-DNA glycosylase family 4
MSLDLDKRQRAMLREMGIRLWQPQQPPAAATEVAGVVAPVDAPTISASTPTPAVVQAQPNAATHSSVSNVAPSRRPPVESAPAPSNPANATTSHSAWTLGEARALFAKPAADNGRPAALGAAARWLLLIETPPGATETDPLASDTGKLLDNMLRAAGLHQSASAVCVPLSRRVDPLTAANAGNAASLEAALTELLKAEKPDVILIMGRLAAQALLQSTEPLGKLRGRAHQVAGVAAVVTYDAAYLLRSLPDKAKAWDDLCRAQHIAHAASSAT